VFARADAPEAHAELGHMVDRPPRGYFPQEVAERPAITLPRQEGYSLLMAASYASNTPGVANNMRKSTPTSSALPALAISRGDGYFVARIIAPTASARAAATPEHARLARQRGHAFVVIGIARIVDRIVVAEGDFHGRQIRSPASDTRR